MPPGELLQSGQRFLLRDDTLQHSYTVREPIPYLAFVPGWQRSLLHHTLYGLYARRLRYHRLRSVVGKKVREKPRMSGEAIDRVVGVAIVLIGVYFLYLAFW